MDDGDFKFIKDFGHLVKVFVLQGFDLWLWPPQQSIVDIFSPLTNMTSLVMSRTDLPPSLRFLRLMPPTLVNLQLDNLLFPPCNFITYLPHLKNQLDKLSLTNNLQLTCYHLVAILQHFWKLDTLAIRNSEFIRAGTCGTILTHCYNLQTFMFSLQFKIHDGRAWIDLVELDFQHVEFDQVVYDEV